MRTTVAVLAATVLIVAESSACDLSQFHRDLAFCTNNAERHIQCAMCRSAGRGETTPMWRTFRECQKDQRNADQVIANGAQCERDVAGRMLQYVQGLCASKPPC